MAEACPRSAADLASEESAQAAVSRLRVLFGKLDLIDDSRAELMRDIQTQTRELAKARGLPFLRLDIIRRECS